MLLAAVASMGVPEGRRTYPGKRIFEHIGAYQYAAYRQGYDTGL